MRADLEIICNWIRAGSTVLDLGCGDGTLLKHLAKTRNVSGTGLELDDNNIVRCIENGVNVVQMDLNKGLVGYFEHYRFDYVVMTQTLQALPHPEILLDEMLRIGNEGIITFPNMGYWRNRLQIMFGGRMPVTKALPETWFKTENIHLCTTHDFEDLCRDKGVRILERDTMNSGHRNHFGMHFMPNLTGEIAFYHVSRKQPHL